jgi:hypothetical protein
MSKITVSVADWIDASFESDVAGGLAAFNAAQLGPSSHRDLAVSLYRDDEFVGGLAGLRRGTGFSSNGCGFVKTHAVPVSPLRR